MKVIKIGTSDCYLSNINLACGFKKLLNEADLGRKINKMILNWKTE